MNKETTGFYKIVKCPNEERNEKGQLACYKKGLCWNYNKCTISKPATEQDLNAAGYVKRDKVKIEIIREIDELGVKEIIRMCPLCKKSLFKSDKYCRCCGSEIIT